MKKQGGAGGNAMTIIIIIVLIGVILAWMRVNNITGLDDVYNYFKSASDKINECGADDVDWNCSPDTSNPSGTEDPQISETPDEVTNESSSSELLLALQGITIADSEEVEYDRSEWKHWSKVSGSCDTRETILSLQGENVVSDPNTCKATSGTWIDPYSGATFTNSSDLDIDHVIPLGYAASHGGQNWTLERKEQFANDMSQLLAVSASENRSKSDSGPSEYMPIQSFQCEYSKIWIATAIKYDISITQDDESALEKGLSYCEVE